MPDPETFDETLEELASYVEDIGDEVYKKSVPNILNVTVRDQEYSLTGHQCVRGDNRYVVAGHPDFRFVSVVYFLSIQNNLAADLTPDLAKDIVESDYEDEEELFQEAANKLLNQVPRSEMKSFESYCYQFISGSTHETNFITNDSGTLLHYGVSQDIFPFEDSFEISDFYEAVRTVVSTGKRGSKLVGRTIYLDIDSDSPEDSEVMFNFNW